MQRLLPGAPHALSMKNYGHFFASALILLAQTKKP